MGIKKAAYIKNGDVVLEYEQLQAGLSKDGDLGYLGRFYELGKNTSLILISFGQRRIHHRRNQVELNVFNMARWTKTAGKAASFVLQAVSTLWTLIRARPDFILCGTIDGSFLGALVASKLILSPIIFSYHASLQPGTHLAGRVRRQVHNSLIKRCDMVMSNGPYLHDEVIKNGIPSKRNVMFIPTFNALFTPVSQDGAEEFGDYILFMGRLKKRKGIFDLLAAFSTLARKHENLNLVFAGTGPEKAKLANMATALYLDKRVFLPGRIPYDQMNRLIRGSRFVVTPSKGYMGEGICKAAVEALVMGKTIIAPDYGPFPYLISHRVNGLLYRTDRTDELTQRMLELLNTPGLLEDLANGALRRGQLFRSSGLSFSRGMLESLNRLGLDTGTGRCQASYSNRTGGYCNLM